MFKRRFKLNGFQRGNWILMGAFLLVASLAWAQTPQVSRFGEYSGFSQEIYDGYQRTSYKHILVYFTARAYLGQFSKNIALLCLLK